MSRLGDLCCDLVSWKFAALAGLGALGHFDLKFVSVGQVGGCYTKAARGHLLDGRARFSLNEQQ